MFNPASTFGPKQPVTFNFFKTGATTQIVSNGTTAKTFVPTIREELFRTDFKVERVRTKNYCISAMSEYQNKSFEELRFEDYKAKTTKPKASISFAFRPAEPKEPIQPTFTFPTTKPSNNTIVFGPPPPLTTKPIIPQPFIFGPPAGAQNPVQTQQKPLFDFSQLTKEVSKQPSNQTTNPFIQPAPTVQQSAPPFVFPISQKNPQTIVQNQPFPSVSSAANNNPTNQSNSPFKAPILQESRGLFDFLKSPSKASEAQPNLTSSTSGDPSSTTKRFDDLQWNPSKQIEIIPSLTQSLDSPVKTAMAEKNLAVNPYGDSPLQALATSLKIETKISVEKPITPRFREKMNVSPREENKTDFLSTKIPAVGEKKIPRSILKKSSIPKDSIRYLDMIELKETMEGLRFKKRETDPDELPSLGVLEDEKTSPIEETIVENSSYVIPQLSGLSPAGITVNNGDYYCEPSLEEMSKMIQDGEVYFPNGLIVGHKSYGNIYWPGPLFLRDIALDEVIIFRHKEIVVYPDDLTKPLIGEELNRPAEITLDGVWYVNKETKEAIKDTVLLTEIGWRDRLERITLKMGANFKDYRPATGSWVFRVENFGEPEENEEIAAVN